MKQSPTSINIKPFKNFQWGVLWYNGISLPYALQLFFTAEKQRRKGNNFKGDIQALPRVTAAEKAATINRAPVNTHMQILQTPNKLSGTQRKHRVTLRCNKNAAKRN